MWWILVPLQSRASWQMPHPPVSSYDTPYTAKKGWLYFRNTSAMGAPQCPVKDAKFPFLPVEVCAALETVSESATPTSVLSVEHTLQPLTRVKLIFYVQHPVWKIPRDLACFLALAWAGCVCVITAPAIILEKCKSEQTLSYGKTHSWFFYIGNKQ